MQNGSESLQRLCFRARNNYRDVMEHKMDLIPTHEGLLTVNRIYSQVPDWDEDFTEKTSGLQAPWLGVSGGGLSAMSYFSGWAEFEHGIPGTEEEQVLPGDILASPSFFVLPVRGDHRTLLTKAESMGWNVGNWQRKASFPCDNLKPLMASGAKVRLSHPLHGGRTAEVKCCGKTVCEGTVKTGTDISGVMAGTGVEVIELILSKRKTVKPVYLVSGRSAAASESGGILRLDNGRVTALIDPAACGQVFSLKLDGVEYLYSSRPEPSEFGWEKPWFGGIHPRYMGGSNNRPFPLENHPPELEECSRTRQGLRETGWRMSWKLDSRDMGTVDIRWTVWMFPEVPVLSTELGCVAPDGEYVEGELDVRGFLMPGGSFENCILTCDTFPGLLQGREHTGAWAPMGGWARVQNGRTFVEAFPGEEGKFLCEDYGSHGCHLSLYDVHLKESHLDMNWLFGSNTADDSLSDVFRTHR